METKYVEFKSSLKAPHPIYIFSVHAVKLYYHISLCSSCGGGSDEQVGISLLSSPVIGQRVEPILASLFSHELDHWTVTLCVCLPQSAKVPTAELPMPPGTFISAISLQSLSFSLSARSWARFMKSWDSFAPLRAHWCISFDFICNCGESKIHLTHRE